MKKETVLELAHKHTVGGLEFDEDGLFEFTKEIIHKVLQEERKACKLIAQSYIDEEWPGDELSIQAENIFLAIESRNIASSPW